LNCRRSGLPKQEAEAGALSDHGSNLLKLELAMSVHIKRALRLEQMERSMDWMGQQNVWE